MFKKTGYIFAILSVICVPFFAYAKEGKEVSDEQVLLLAKVEAKEGKTENSVKLLAALTHSKNTEIRIESVFQLAGMAAAQGDYDTAIEYLQAILKNNPGLSRVRLELARCYFLNGDYSEAEFHFQFVRATSDLPPEVAEKIDNFLTQIRQKKNWTLDFGFSIVPDSNLNYSSGASDECAYFAGFGYFCRPLEGKKSGVGVRLNTEGNYYLRFNKHWGIRTTLGLSLLDFPTSEFDDYSTYFAIGPRYVFEKGELSLQPTFNSRWYGGDFYNYGYGLKFDTNWQLAGKWFAGTGAYIRKNIYADNNMEDILGGNSWGVYLRPKYYLNNKSYVFVGLGFDQDNTNIETFGNNSISYSAGYFGEFWYGFNLFGRVDLITSKYHGDRLFVIDEEFKTATRNDLTWQFYTRIYNTKLEWHNIVPAISYTYTNRHSNIPSYIFDKHRIELELVKRF